MTGRPSSAYRAGVDRVITTTQAEKLCQQLRPHLAYLHRLRERMEKRGFTPDDRLYRAACDAFNAVYALHVEAHYASIEHGVGRAP